MLAEAAPSFLEPGVAGGGVQAHIVICSAADSDHGLSRAAFGDAATLRAGVAPNLRWGRVSHRPVPPLAASAGRRASVPSQLIGST